MLTRLSEVSAGGGLGVPGQPGGAGGGLAGRGRGRPQAAQQAPQYDYSAVV